MQAYLQSISFDWFLDTGGILIKGVYFPKAVQCPAQCIEQRVDSHVTQSITCDAVLLQVNNLYLPLRLRASNTSCTVTVMRRAPSVITPASFKTVLKKLVRAVLASA